MAEGVILVYQRPLAERLWARVRKTDKCWIWEGSRTGRGYGTINRGKRGEGVVSTHRAAWEVTYGPIPQGQYLLHSCDNPPCCNPAHLRLGSSFENRADLLARGVGKATPRQHIAPKRYIAPIEDRFWPRVVKTDSCWIWDGPKLKFGHGYLGRGGRGAPKVLAHRLSWELHHGQIPESLMVLHRCDVPSCVNPEHLFLGTKADNSKDMVQKGRSRRGDNHQNGKLTERQVRDIRERWATRPLVNRRPARNGPDSMSAIARDYGVNHVTVLNIIRNQSWTAPRSPRRGERMTFDLAQSIRRRYADRARIDDPNSVTNIAKDYGVNEATIRDIVHYKTWSHVH